MKLKYQFEHVEMGDDIICVPVGNGAKQIHGVLRVNKSGRQIIDLLKNETSVDQVVNTISKSYDNNPQELREFVNETINVLQDASLIEM